MKPPEHFNGMTTEGELNPGFEEENKRKISIVSNDRERKVSSISMPKSILVNGDNLSHLSHASQESVGDDAEEEKVPSHEDSLSYESFPKDDSSKPIKKLKQKTPFVSPASQEAVGDDAEEEEVLSPEESLFSGSSQKDDNSKTKKKIKQKTPSVSPGTVDDEPDPPQTEITSSPEPSGSGYDSWTSLGKKGGILKPTTRFSTGAQEGDEAGSSRLLESPVPGYDSLASRPPKKRRVWKPLRFSEHGRALSIPSEHHASFAYPREEQDIKTSWWYILCTKCRQKETGPGWEPSFWQTFCPYPFCPTYRHVARVFALLLLVILAWGIIFSIMGEDSAPGGQFFDIAFLCICGHIGGWFFRMIALPPLVGMLLVGILFRNVGFIEIQGQYNELVSILRKIALVNILIRAGLDLDSEAMKRLWLTVLKIGLLPWMLECLVVLVLSHFFLGLPWMWGLLLGSIVAAVSPAVVVPCLFRLRNKGYGVAKGIPTLIIAISGMDDAASVAAFGIIHSIMFSSHSLYFEIILGLLSIVIGILFGVLWGILASYVPEKDDPFVVPLRILILLGGGLIAVLGSDLVGLGGAGPLGCIAAAFLSVYAWTKQGWDVEDNPVATAFEIFWMIFEPILFTLTGTQIKISEMDPNIAGIGVAILVTAFILRILFTIAVGFGASLNLKEKIFCGISLMAKASVQAALGPIAVDIVRDRDGPEPGYAATVALICVMSILLAAPVGSILIILTGSRLLTKTEVPTVPDGWRRSARPSLRDITLPEDYSDDSFSNHRSSIPSEQVRLP